LRARHGALGFCHLRSQISDVTPLMHSDATADWAAEDETVAMVMDELAAAERAALAQQLHSLHETLAEMINAAEMRAEPVTFHDKLRAAARIVKERLRSR
jgi:hypothetical protein